VVGVFSGKAVLVIDGDGPHTVPVGATRQGVRVLATDANGAVLEIDGQRVSASVGAAPMRAAPDTNRQVVLSPDTRGHYLARGTINGAAVTFLVDTGASAVTVSSEFARQAGIDVAQGRPVVVTTANGQVRARLVRLDSVALGGVVAHQVDAIVQDGLGTHALLGMSFLRRMEMRHDGERLVLTKRY